MQLDDSIEKCYFCTHINQQKKVLTALLLRKLRNQMQLSGRRYLSHGTETQNLGFRQVIRILFGHELNRETNCQHNKYQIFLQKKLECSQQNFNFLCERVSYRLAQKNYHLQLLATQIKNVAEAVVEGRVETESSSVSLSPTDKEDPLLEVARQKQPKEPRSREYSNKSHEFLSKANAMEENQGATFGDLGAALGGSLQFIPANKSEVSIMNEPCSQINLGYSYYYSPFPIYFPHPE